MKTRKSIAGIAASAILTATLAIGSAQAAEASPQATVNTPTTVAALPIAPTWLGPIGWWLRDWGRLMQGRITWA